MSTRPSFSLGRALSAAFAGLPSMWSGAWAVLILWAAAGAFLPQLNPQSIPAFVIKAGTAILLLIFQYVAYGALYRIALFGRNAGKEGLGFGGLQLAWPELRLFLAELIVGLFAVLIVVAIGVVFFIAFNTAGMAEGHADTFDALRAMIQRHEGKDWIFISYLAAAWVFLIFLSLKFVLMGAANVAERRLVTLNALGLSSGNVGKLFIGLIVLFVPFVIVAIVVTAGAGVGGVTLGHGTSGLLVAHYVLQAVTVFLLIPVMIGFLSSAYGQIVASRTR
ncbi:MULTISPECIES: hypothetical protein [Asticcacaulis]|uniref:hypothetical protein n=1 Tax=Asticcacaulis TaxID=76890 RepID=UPI001AE3C137|nr:MULTISPECIES: hypothetical protein [Asticcacaulis]MBP2158527.1 hypothetical protein [Asticcacaulis solisilvae]MDR6799573.1 hypothetical protein [Asticcacaulis sp. BE141]